MIKHFIASIILFSTIASAEVEKNAVVSTQVRQSEATKVITPDVIGLYVKGLICESCGIGIKIKTKRLKFLDKTQLDKGIQIDSKNQLLYIAVDKNQRADKAAIAKAVKDAGYTPVTFFEIKKGKLVTEQVN